MNASGLNPSQQFQQQLAERGLAARQQLAGTIARDVNNRPKELQQVWEMRKNGKSALNFAFKSVTKTVEKFDADPSTGEEVPGSRVEKLVATEEKDLSRPVTLNDGLNKCIALDMHRYILYPVEVNKEALLSNMINEELMSSPYNSFNGNNSNDPNRNNPKYCMPSC